MKKLTELLTKIDPTDLSGRERQLLDSILYNEWQNESDLAEMLWPGDANKRDYFRQIKENLLGHTIDLIFKEKAESHYSSKIIEFYKEFSAIQILGSIGKREEYIYFSEHLIKKAIRYDMVDIVSSLANTLYHHYASIKGDIAETKKYLNLSESFDEILMAERKIQRWFSDLAMDFTVSRTGKKDTAEKAQKYLDEIAAAPFHDTYRYRYYAYYIQCIHAQLEGDTVVLSNICDQALLYFQKKTYPIPNSVHFLFGFEQRASLALQQRDYQLATKAIQWGKETMNTSPYNLGVCLIYQATIGFHCGDEDLIRRAIEESRQYEMPAPQAEQWTIIRAYAHLLGVLQDDGFRLSKFLNELPKFSKDKAGLNVSIITIQTLYYLNTGDYAQLIDRREALQKYCNRYLSGRADCFVRMLLSISQYDFDPQKIESYALEKGYLQKLVDSPQVEDAEIVPFEKLWENVMVELLAAGASIKLA